MSTAISVPHFVVDASVVSKWHLRDEQYVLEADALLSAFQAGHVDLLAPDHIRYEVPSAIRKSVRTRRITNDQARQSRASFLAWHLPTVSDDDLMLAAFEVTVRFNCSLYDGRYLALSDASQFPLIYADDLLRHALGVQFSLAVWIEDWHI